MRWYLVQEFESYLRNISLELQGTKIAMVGGYSTDPELAILQSILKEHTVTYYGIDSDYSFEYIDINIATPEKLTEQYDLVLCSQVIEHVWNVNNFFLLLDKLTRKNGFLWISAPYSNITHGSPDFFSSGYTPEFLSNNLGSNKWDFRCVGRIGTKRNYLATHVLGSWLSKEELEKPVINYEIKPGTALGNLRKYISEFPGRLFLSCINNEISNNPRWSTESYVLARKK